MSDRILILDFGSQVTQLIARRVRESGVYCEIQPFTIGEDRVRDFAPRGIILSGGPASLTEAASPRAPEIVFRLGVPVLGICYGMQTMCAQLGGRVTLSEHQEFGRAFIDILDECRLFDGLWPKGGREQVWMSHGDRVDALPLGFRAAASSEGGSKTSPRTTSRRWPIQNPGAIPPGAITTSRRGLPPPRAVSDRPAAAACSPRSAASRTSRPSA